MLIPVNIEQDRTIKLLLSTSNSKSLIVFCRAGIRNPEAKTENGHLHYRCLFILTHLALSRTFAGRHLAETMKIANRPLDPSRHRRLSRLRSSLLPPASLYMCSS